MKTILVATDLSEAANNACLYAVQFAKAFNAKVILFHALRFMYPPAGSLVVSSSAELKQNCEDELQQYADELIKKAGNNVDVEVVVEDTAKITDSIVSTAIEKEASLIFLGMKGQGKGIRKMFGSTVTALSHSSSVPLLVIPEKSKYVEPKTITLANDIGSSTDLRILDPLKEIGDHFNSQLLIVRVIKDRREEVFERLHRSKFLQLYLASLDPQYIYTIDKSVADGLGRSVAEYKGNMIVMIPHLHNLFERIFERSYTNDMLFNTNVPVLILQDKLLTVGKEPTVAMDMEDYFAIE